VCTDIYTRTEAPLWRAQRVQSRKIVIPALYTVSTCQVCAVCVSRCTHLQQLLIICYCWLSMHCPLHIFLLTCIWVCVYTYSHTTWQVWRECLKFEQRLVQPLREKLQEVHPELAQKALDMDMDFGYVNTMIDCLIDWLQVINHNLHRMMLATWSVVNHRVWSTSSEVLDILICVCCTIVCNLILSRTALLTLLVSLPVSHVYASCLLLLHCRSDQQTQEREEQEGYWSSKRYTF
jgi:hypothetical protein